MLIYLLLKGRVPVRRRLRAREGVHRLLLRQPLPDELDLPRAGLLPGQKPRGSRTVQTQQSNPQSHVSESNFGSTNSTSVSTSSSTSNIMSGGVTSGTKGEKVLLTSYEMLSGDNVVENNNDIEKINVNNAQVNILR